MEELQVKHLEETEPEIEPGEVDVTNCITFPERVELLEERFKNVEHDLDQVMSLSLVALLCGITAVFAVLIGGFTGWLI